MVKTLITKIIKLLSGAFALLVLMMACTQPENSAVYEIIYEEQEEGTDVYEVKYTVSQKHIRIDEPGDDSGYIVYDDVKKQILSVSHEDKRVLVINEYTYEIPEIDGINIEYKKLEDAPSIDKHVVFSYNIIDTNAVPEEECVQIQLAENLLVGVTAIFNNYYRVLAGQLAQSLSSIPEEYKTPCYLANQVYNTGGYYNKGLPIHELHSHGKVKSLKSYGKIEIDPKIFEIPEDYTKYSIDEGLPITT